MKFLVDNLELSRALSSVSRAISSKSTMPIMECVYMETDENEIVIKGSDAEISIITRIPAQIYMQGNITVQFRTLMDLTRTYPNEKVEFSADERNVLTIKCAKSEVSIPGRDASEYPIIQEYGASQNEAVVLKNDIFRDLIKDTVFACAPQININPVLMGVFIECTKDEIQFTALDGYKMAMRKEKFEEECASAFSVIMPGRALNEILRILSMYDADAHLFMENNKMIVNIGDTQIISMLIEGVFINYRALIPAEIKSVVKVERDDLLISVERACLITDERRNSLIKMEFTDEALYLNSSSEKGNISDDIVIQKSGDDLKIAFNARYYSEILKNIRDERVIIEFKDQNGPCLIKPVDSDKFMYLVMPVRYVE